MFKQVNAVSLSICQVQGAATTLQHGVLVLLQKFVKHGNQVVGKGEHIVLAKVALIVITLSEDAQVDSGACCINIKLIYFQF